MSKTVALLLCVLVVSLIANGHLLLTRGEPVTEPKETKPAPRSPRASVPTPRGVPMPPPSPDTLPSKAEIPSSYAKFDRPTLEQRLANAEARVDTLLPIQEKFALNEPAPEHEDELRPMLDRVFETKPGDAPKYEIECRGMICHLTATNSAASDWTNTLQADPDRAGFNAMSFGQDGVYMQLEEPERAASNKLMAQIAVALGVVDGRIADCKMNNPSHDGKMVATITFDAGPRQLKVDVTGALASDAVGVCVRRVVEEMVAKIAIAPEVKGIEPLPLPVMVP